MQASYQIRTSYENNFTAGLFVSVPSRKEADARIALLFPSPQTSAIVFATLMFHLYSSWPTTSSPPS